MIKIPFQDLPNTTTPVSATNLNDLQDNVEDAIDSLFDSGNWTPVMVDANVTYTKQTGKYYKIGNLVNLTFQLEGVINSVTSPAYAFISGVPYEAQYQQAGSLNQYANCFSDNTTSRLLRIVGNLLGIQDASSGGTNISIWQASSDTFYLYGTITYMSAD